MDISKYLRDQLLLAQHHVNDAETAPNKEVLDSSLGDTEELIDRMAKVLPKKEQESVKLEQQQKEAVAAVSKPHKVIPMNQRELLKQAEEAAAIDRANAFEVGFAKAAQDKGLTEEQYNEMRAYGIAYLQKQAEGEIAPVIPPAKAVMTPPVAPAKVVMSPATPPAKPTPIEAVKMGADAGEIKPQPETNVKSNPIDAPKVEGRETKDKKATKPEPGRKPDVPDSDKSAK
jgi:hypothetical protein